MHPIPDDDLRAKRADSLREELGLPPLSKAKEAFHGHLVAALSRADYPIRNRGSFVER
jgi:hypothetical protein